MLDIDSLEIRNCRELEKLILLYSINRSVEDLINMASMYVAQDKDTKEVEALSRIRLMCTEKIYEVKDMGKYSRKEVVQTKKVQLYTINNKTIKKLNEKNELRVAVDKLEYMCSLVKELQLFRDIRKMEEAFATLNGEL